MREARAVGRAAGIWWAWVLAALATGLGAAPAVAQPDGGVPADSLGVAVDAVPLPVQDAATECDPYGMRVVRDSAGARALQRFRGCGPDAFPLLGRRLYVHATFMGDCLATYGLGAYASASRREYRIVLTTRDGGCRSGSIESRWVLLPPLPAGWTVGFTRVRMEGESTPLRPDSLGVAGDAVQVSARPAWTDCRPAGYVAVRGAADARELQGFPGCATLPAAHGALLVHLPEPACTGRYAVRAYRSPSRREIRVVRVARSRGCGASRGGPRWFRLPTLPPGWTVAVTDTAA